MKAHADFQRTDDIEVAITITMTLREWTLVVRDLTGASIPSIYVCNAIEKASRAATERMQCSTED